MVEIGGRPILWHVTKIYRGLYLSDITIDLSKNSLEFHRQNAENWRVTLVDTGESTMTGGRLKRVARHLRDGEDFCFTHGDGVTSLVERPEGEGSFLLLNPKVLDRIEGDPTSFEGEPLFGLARDGELTAWFHEGFWRPMDTLRDKIQLDDLWAGGNPPWNVW